MDTLVYREVRNVIQVDSKAMELSSAISHREDSLHKKLRQGTASASLGVSMCIDALPTRVVGLCAPLYYIGYHRWTPSLCACGSIYRSYLVPGTTQERYDHDSNIARHLRHSIWLLYRGAQPEMQRSPDSPAVGPVAEANYVYAALLASFSNCRRMFCLTRGIASIRERIHRSRAV